MLRILTKLQASMQQLRPLPYQQRKLTNLWMIVVLQANHKIHYNAKGFTVTATINQADIFFHPSLTFVAATDITVFYVLIKIYTSMEIFCMPCT